MNCPLSSTLGHLTDRLDSFTEYSSLTIDQLAISTLYIYYALYEDVMQNNYSIGFAAMLLTLAAIGTIALTSLIQPQDARAPIGLRQAPPVITGNNVYVAWWSNKTANNNDDVLFRASTDGGQTFSDKMNLSNSTDLNSSRVEIDADADSVVVTWWEANQTAETPVMRVSNDNGETFGPVLKLATNGTIGESE
jgi:hypothetical protein